MVPQHPQYEKFVEKRYEEDMRRIAIIGCSGAGKSTLARRLASITGIPLIVLDHVYWRPNWTKSPKLEWRKTLTELVDQDSWIIDGNFESSLDIRLKAADTVVFLDLPRWRCVLGICIRLLRNYGQDTQAPGCPNKFDRKFFGYVWSWRKVRRPLTIEAMRQYAPSANHVVLGSRREVDEFLQETKYLFRQYSGAGKRSKWHRVIDSSRRKHRVQLIILILLAFAGLAGHFMDDGLRELLVSICLPVMVLVVDSTVRVIYYREFIDS